MRKFTADFETNVDENDCRVWAYSICEIGNIDNFIYGNNIEDFIKWCSDPKENYRVYFHNLKFDGEYIFSYLLNNGYECVKDKKDVKDKTFTCLIGEMGQFYSIEIYFEVKSKKHINKVTIYDSFKILAMSVRQIAKEFSLPIRKLNIDYKEYREVGHVLTSEEIDYIRNDVEIMARALEIMFKEGLTKMTIGANALSNFRDNNSYFNQYFPEIPYEIDADIRTSYKGGFTYLNPLYKEKEVKKGIVLDVNSLYPSVMMNDKMPFGTPIYFEGKYQKDFLHPLYVQRISCSFKVKKNKIPTIQIKGSLDYIENEYIEDTFGDIVTLTLTNIDLELFFNHYEVTSEVIYQGGYKFKCIDGIFSSYINYWSDKKIESKKEGNSALYKISKLMLNSLYGKFSKNPNIISKYPVLEEGIIKYKNYDLEIGKSLYIPIGSFITAYARRKTIETSQKIRDYTLSRYGVDYYIYSDTDSIHMLELKEEELKEFIDIDDYILGYWKLESDFIRGKYIRQKCYIEESLVSIEDYNKILNKCLDEEEQEEVKPYYTYDDKLNKYRFLNCTVAGLPKALSKYVNFENFKPGFNISASEKDKDHKLTYKHVKGGVMLVDTDFTIK